MTNYTKKKLSRSIANTKGGAFFGLKTAKEKAAAAEAAAAAAEAAAAEAAAAEAARIAQLTSEALKAKQRETQKKENRLKILKQFATETESETHKLNQTKKRNQRTQNYEKQRIRVAQQMEETRKAQNQLQKTQANKLQFRIAKAKAESLQNQQKLQKLQKQNNEFYKKKAEAAAKEEKEAKDKIRLPEIDEIIQVTIPPNSVSKNTNYNNLEYTCFVDYSDLTPLNILEKFMINKPGNGSQRHISNTDTIVKPFFKTFIKDLCVANKGLSAYHLFWIIKMQNIFKITYDKITYDNINMNTQITDILNTILNASIHDILINTLPKNYTHTHTHKVTDKDVAFIVNQFCDEFDIDFNTQIIKVIDTNIEIYSLFDLSKFSSKPINAIKSVTDILKDKHCNNKPEYLFKLNPFDTKYNDIYNTTCKPLGTLTKLFKKTKTKTIENQLSNYTKKKITQADKEIEIANAISAIQSNINTNIATSSNEHNITLTGIERDHNKEKENYLQFKPTFTNNELQNKLQFSKIKYENLKTISILQNCIELGTIWHTYTQLKLTTLKNLTENKNELIIYTDSNAYADKITKLKQEFTDNCTHYKKQILDCTNKLLQAKKELSKTETKQALLNNKYSVNWPDFKRGSIVNKTTTKANNSHNTWASIFFKTPEHVNKTPEHVKKQAQANALRAYNLRTQMLEKQYSSIKQPKNKSPEFHAQSIARNKLLHHTTYKQKLVENKTQLLIQHQIQHQNRLRNFNNQGKRLQQNYNQKNRLYVAEHTQQPLKWYQKLFKKPTKKIN